MTYRTILPSVFPYAVRVHRDRITYIVATLMAEDPMVPNGSSFAVTTDAAEGFRWLWLSTASAKRLMRHEGRMLYDIRRDLGSQAIRIARRREEENGT